MRPKVSAPVSDLHDGSDRRAGEHEPGRPGRLEAARLHRREPEALAHDVGALVLEDDGDVDPVGRDPRRFAVEATVVQPEPVVDIVDHDGAASRRGRVREPDCRSGAVERDRGARVDRRQLLEHERPHERAGLRADESERREFPAELRRDAAGLLVRAQTRQQPILREAPRRLLYEPLLVGEREAEAHAGFFGGSETRSVPCATQARRSPLVTSTRTIAVRRPSETTVDSATIVPPRTGAR